MSGMKLSALDRVIDSLDIETFLVCRDKDEGEKLGLRLMQELGFKDVDIIFIEHSNGGARVRLRANVYRPGDKYKWYIPG